MDIEVNNKYQGQNNQQHLQQNYYSSSDESNQMFDEYGYESNEYEQPHQQQGIYLNKSINLGNQQNGGNFYQSNIYHQQIDPCQAQQYYTESSGSQNSHDSNQNHQQYNMQHRDSYQSDYPNSSFGSQESTSNLSHNNHQYQNTMHNYQHDPQYYQNHHFMNQISNQSSRTVIQNSQKQASDEDEQSNQLSSSQQTQQQNKTEDQLAVKKEFKAVELIAIPLLKNLRQREIYLLYGEILVELDTIFELNILDRNSGYNHFKKVQSVKQRADNGYVEIIFDTFAEPLREFQFLIERIRNQPNQKALELSKIIEQYYNLVQKQLAEDELLKTKYPKDLIHQRHSYCQQKSEELISMLDENANVFYYQCRMNPQTFEPINFKQGYSRKLAWVFGCSPEVLSMLYMRYGQLDFTKCASKIEMTMQKVLSNFSDMFRERFMRENNYQARDKNINNVISQNILTMDMQTIDDLLVPLTCVVSRISLSQDFDDLHGIKGLMPECLLICDVKVEIRYMHMLIKHRCEQLPTTDHYIKSFVESHKICENEEYYCQSKDFLEKFYPKDEDQNKVMIKPKFKKNTTNLPNLSLGGNKVSDETLNQIYQILQQRS